jgi:transposase
LRAFGVYLVVHQHLPYERACQLLCDLGGTRVSTGTLKSWVDEAASGLADFACELRALLCAEPVVHFDETGGRIEGSLEWIHSASTDELTLYGAHPKRGTEAIDSLGVLPGFCGVAVHDGWRPYRRYERSTHALCNGHHLRELQGVVDIGQENQSWADQMAILLWEVSEAVDRAKGTGATGLPSSELGTIKARYEAIIALGHEQNPAPTERSGRRGPTRRSKAHNLLRRLDRDREDVLRFAHDFRVPFTNNRAEQDIRMVKLQQKISGCFRTRAGARSFLLLRSYTSTARKQGQRPLAALAALASGRPWMPVRAPT